MARKTAILDMRGAGCVSCAYAIERLGRKRPGVEDVRVDIAHSEIRVVYDGPDDVLNQILDIVKLIGHDAVVKRVQCGDLEHE
jgi:Cu+-exporting ATPase